MRLSMFIINRNVECAFQCSEAPLSLHPLFDGWQVRKATQHWKARSTLRFLFSKTRFRQIFRHTPVDFYVLPPDLKTAFGNVAQDENYKWRRRDTTTGTTNDDKRWQGDDDRRHTTTAAGFLRVAPRSKNCFRKRGTRRKLQMTTTGHDNGNDERRQTMTRWRRPTTHHNSHSLDQHPVGELRNVVCQ